MKKSFLSLSITAALIAGSIPAFGGTASAETMDDLKNKQNDIQQEREEVSGEISSKNKNIEKVIEKQKKITAQIKELDGKISKTNDDIDRVSAEINDTTAQIEELREEIETLKKKIAERTALLEERARAIQISGGDVSYMDVLLGAESFSDFIDRFSAVNTLVDADRQIMEEQSRDQEALEQKEAEVKEQLASLESKKAELDGLKSSLYAQKQDKKGLVAELEAQQATLEEEKSNLQDQDSELKELESEVADSIVAEQERLAELARQKEIERKAEEKRQREAAAAAAAAAAEEKAAAERAAKEQAAAEQAAEQAAQKQSTASQTSTAPSQSSQSAPVSTPAPAAKPAAKPAAEPATSAGAWTTPAFGRTTSEFGYDILNGKPRIHYGIDVAAPQGTSIVSAASGYVVKANSGDNGGYGQMVIVTHSINGKTFTTVYAHLSSIAVSNGQYLEKGQYIGGMGDTGYSFGSHLHFELHEGSWNASKSNAVNPRKYISF
ncbi:murein hydrolase activator EnvC family protein [Jeotgalibacillus campisalis]|uniref:Peptidase M23 n=1 Tax=Jeotgalibacillus campisalis TaxID=220754 RepID=A0A0C2V1K1_9BACL|nr:peptidoglycan DD-metalloendopeptidase family protein [Jeotgalibacillus campisalis]KIL42947.1 peptidase M23 [Jeotgalibacillus campisalis]